LFINFCLEILLKTATDYCQAESQIQREMHGACYWQCPTTGKNSVKKFLEPEHHQSLITRCQSHIPRLKIFIKIRRQLFEMSC